MVSRKSSVDRQTFIGGSDARIIMGNDERELLRLWREKRGELEPEDLSGNLIVQLGLVTEALNRNWYERNTGRTVECVQHRVRHPVLRWMGATLDGMVAGSGAVFEAKFMLPWSFSEQAAAEKHMPQVQHNMWVTNAKLAALSVITGGGKWVEITLSADPLYQHLLLTAERKFWRCVENGEPPRLFGIDPPRPLLEAVRIVDMTASNAWAEFAAVFRATRQAFLDHEKSKAELKGLIPPLASGLDIVRKTLGRHEIAAVQSTEIDKEAGLIRLTTILAHASGEWLSSDWPVCAIAETAAPHRMGAALTYARRYALFTLVGIAGEDDLDAPDLNGRPQSGGTADVGATSALAPSQRSRRPGGNGNDRGRPTLDPDASAVMRDHLVHEVASVASAAEAAQWARTALPVKNKLTAPDARVVELAFDLRLSAFEVQG